MSRIEDSCATDLERISVRPSMPLSCSSIGTVISCFDLVGGVAERDGLDLDLGRGELREDVDLGVRDLGEPKHQECGGGEDHEPPEPQARTDDVTHQPPPRTSVPAVNPQFGAVHLGRADGDDPFVRRLSPSDSSTVSPSMRSTTTSARRNVNSLGAV